MSTEPSACWQPEAECMPRGDLEQLQLERLQATLSRVYRNVPFYRKRFDEIEFDPDELRSLDEVRRLPFTMKHDLGESYPYGLFAVPLRDVVRLHASGGTGSAAIVLGYTRNDVKTWSNLNARTLVAGGVTKDDVVQITFDYGMLTGAFGVHYGAERLGASVIPISSGNTKRQIKIMQDYKTTALACTPSYALHLAQVAQRHGLGDALESVQRIVCTGEPGASLPAVRDRIESEWGARCFDHAGLTEVGPFGYPCAAAGGMHLFEDEFVCELLDPHDGQPVAPGAEGELVITALGRVGFPVIRYATGDVIDHRADPCPAGHPGRWLPRGILGRTDDMVVIRGMNVFPSAIEQILRESQGVGEFRITFYTDPRAMDEIKIEVELSQPLEARAIQARMRQRLGLRVRLVPVRPGILPEQLGKARRVEDLRPRAAAPERVGR